MFQNLCIQDVTGVEVCKVRHLRKADGASRDFDQREIVVWCGEERAMILSLIGPVGALDGLRFSNASCWVNASAPQPAAVEG